VRDALADLPPSEREELLEDLDDHLAEVAAESGTPLEERLGPPEAYAAELRAAYGSRPATRRRRGDRLRSLRATGRRTHASLSGFAAYRSVAEFLPELRPAWWVVRGYAAAIVLLTVGFGPRVIPENLAEWVVVLALVLPSVMIGRWTREGSRPRWARLGVLAANAAAALALIPMAVAVAEGSARDDDVFVVRRGPDKVSIAEVNSPGGQGVYNIFPYGTDGTPLKNVLLFDQDGRPVIIDPRQYDYEIRRLCGIEQPRVNEYPLPLVHIDGPGFRQEPCRHAVSPPSVTVPPSPFPLPLPSTEPSATVPSGDGAVPSATASSTDAGGGVTPTPASADTPDSSTSPSPTPTK
jgi:hypothetical protein